MGIFGTIAKKVGSIFRPHTPESIWGSNAEPMKDVPSGYRGSSPIKAQVERLFPTPPPGGYRGSSPIKAEIERQFPNDLPWSRPGPYEETPTGTPFTEAPPIEEEVPVPESDIEAFLQGKTGWIDLVSSNVSACLWDPDTHELMIRFHDSSVYGYQNVTHEEAEDFITAPSHGGWVWDNLRRRGTVFGWNPAHPYTFMDYLSGIERLWARYADGRIAHGEISPEGADWSQLERMYPDGVPSHLRGG